MSAITKFPNPCRLWITNLLLQCLGSLEETDPPAAFGLFVAQALSVSVSQDTFSLRRFYLPSSPLLH